jgi:hypothetical protein
MVKPAQFHVTMIQFGIIRLHIIIRQCTCNITMRQVCVNSCCEKAVSITNCECVFVALVSQHAKLMYCILKVRDSHNKHSCIVAEWHTFIDLLV